MITIKKRDGTKEPFIPEKIIVSTMRSGADPDSARTIATETQKLIKDGTSTEEIRKTVLKMLKSKNPQWERNWMLYDTSVKKRLDRL